MTDYSKLSDFEINKAVAISIGFPCYYGNGSYTNNLGLTGAIVKGENNSGLFMVGEFNPCKNPVDAWLIIFENKIMLSPFCANDEWKAQIHLGKEDIFDNYVSAWHKNPLRAAMIVFLMMQDH